MIGSTGTTMFVLAMLLVAVGIAMICTTVWLVRATRSDVRALGPLEAMGDRRWHRGGVSRREQALTDARSPGAMSPAPMLEVAAEAEPDEAPALDDAVSVDEAVSVEEAPPSDEAELAEPHPGEPQPAETA